MTQNLTYRFNNGVPNQLTQSISPWVNDARAGWHALFAQEQWTMGRLTLQGALRFDVAKSWYPEQQEGPTRFLPTPIIIPETKGVDSYKDITPRFGAAYDLFGNGRTAIKASVGKFLEGVGVQLTYANANPTLRVPTTTGPFGTVGVSRGWTDRNNNLVPDCDLLNPQAQTDTVDLCGQMSNVRFGQNVLTGNFDPDLLEGWGVRASDWSLGLSVQQQIFPRMSVEVGYYRRWFDGFTLTDNLAAGPSDYTKYHIVAPVDPRLPGGGGYPVNELFDVIPTLSGQINNLSTLASKYGRWYQYFNGVDVTFSLRTAGGMSFQGGTSTGQNVADNCAVRADLPELNVGLGAGLVGSTVRHDESVLPRGLRRPDAVPRTGFVHDPKDRRPGQRSISEQAWRVTRGQLRGACCDGRSDAGAFTVRGRAQRHD